MIHPDDTKYFDRLAACGYYVAQVVGIRVSLIEPKRRAGGAFGLAYLRERRVSIEVRGRQQMQDGGAWNAQRYSDTTNFDTLAHELAHLWEHQAHGKTGHGARFKGYHKQLVALINSYRINPPADKHAAA